MDRVDHRRKRELAQNGQACAGPAHWFTGGNVAIQGMLYRSILPKANLVGLVSASEGNALGVIDDPNDFRIVGVFPTPPLD
jgi:hypothetical protein